jgi:Ca2+-binding RTX toxin-like protein
VANFTASNDAAVASLGAPTIDITPNDPRYGFLITGLPEAQSGISLAGGGDVNGDGFSDFLIGAPGNDDNLAYTLFGSDFNNTVNQTGTIGDDVMVGSPTGESFVAGQGDDVIATGGGVDVVYAGPGNDQVIVNDVYFQRLDGGPGLDALFFQGYSGQDWDLTTLSPGLRLRNFEFLVTEDYGANTLTLNAVTVTQISPTNTLSLILDGTDSVVLSSDFSYQGTVYQSNRNFQEYTSSSSAARVLINQPNVSVSSTAPSTNTPAPILPTETNTTVVSPELAGANLATSVSEVSATADSDESADFVSTADILDPGNTVPTQIYVSNPTVSERAGRAEFTITRTGDLNQYVWVDYYTQDGDAKAGERYTPVAGQLVFSPGESTAAVTVPIPNNRKYVGKRQFELVVNLEGESIDPSAVPDQWQTAIAAPSEQIRRWNMVPGDNNNNSITLDVTSTKSPNNVATLDLDLKGTVIPQVWNFSTRSYQNIPFNPTNGIVQVQDRNNDLINDLYRLRLQDGGPFDGDGLVNGLIDLNFEIAQLKSVDVPAGGGRVEGTESNNYINAQNSTGTNRLEGQGGMDVLIGSPQRDVLLGGEGNDLLMGGANIDQLYGGAGDDLLDGGLGTNFLYGDVGADSFLLRRGDGTHRVMDFNPAEGDFFLLENLSMSQLGFSGNQIKLGTNTLAIVIDSFGKPVANFAANPSWFSTVLS